MTYPEIARWISPSFAKNENSAASWRPETSRMKVEPLFDPTNLLLEGLTYGKDKDIGALLNHVASWNRSHRDGDIDCKYQLDITTNAY